MASSEPVTKQPVVEDARASSDKSSSDAEKRSLGEEHKEAESIDLPKSTQLKIDLRIIPAVVVIYIMSFLDRINIGNAVVYGLPKELQLQGSQINVALCVFFVSYVIFEIPSTILMKKFKPHVFLSAAMFLFGFLSMMQGFVHNYAGLVAVRFLMGIAEAGVYPGCYYLMSMWYKRRQTQKRFTFFFAGASFAGAFGGLLATAIGGMNGVGGYASWRWIFILEGLVTCLLSFGGYFLISDFPEEARWLQAEEKELVLAALAADQGPSGIEHGVTMKDVTRVLSDWKIFLGAPLYFSVVLSGNGMAFFIPSIVAGYGYSPIQAQLHSAAPWAAALAMSFLVAYLSDRFGRRFLFLMICFVPAFLGNIMLLTIHNNTAAQYGAVTLYLMGVISSVPVIICWYSMNLFGHQERVVGIPWQVGIGNAAGIVSTFAFPKTDAPYYTLGYGLGLGFLCLALGISISYYIGCARINRKVGYAKFVL